MKRLFIGHFGGKNNDDWFFSWANDEMDALKTIERIYGKPEYIEDVSNISSGGFCFKPNDVSNDEKPYYLMEIFQDDFKFENDENIQKIIIKQKNITEDDKLSRDEYRELIEDENKNQKKIEENYYKKMINKIDKI